MVSVAQARPPTRPPARPTRCGPHGAARPVGQAGFSLVEAMIAMTILAIGLLSAAQVIPLALMHTKQGQVRTNAVEVAQEQIDALRAADFTSSVLTAGTYVATDRGYNLVWTITDSVPVPKSKRIALTASWNTVNGVKDATLTTYIIPVR